MKCELGVLNQAFNVRLVVALEGMMMRVITPAGKLILYRL